jgi:hypothetical protein
VLLLLLLLLIEMRDWKTGVFAADDSTGAADDFTGAADDFAGAADDFAGAADLFSSYYRRRRRAGRGEHTGCGLQVSLVL